MKVCAMSGSSAAPPTTVIRRRPPRRASTGFATSARKIGVAEHKIVTDTTVQLKELQLRERLAMLEYANTNNVTLTQAKTELAGVAMKLNVQKELSAVGRANGENMLCIVVPCHRVIRADGTLCGYGGGLWRKIGRRHRMYDAVFIDKINNASVVHVAMNGKVSAANVDGAARWRSPASRWRRRSNVSGVLTCRRRGLRHCPRSEAVANGPHRSSSSPEKRSPDYIRPIHKRAAASGYSSLHWIGSLARDNLIGDILTAHQPGSSNSPGYRMRQHALKRGSTFPYGTKRTERSDVRQHLADLDGTFMCRYVGLLCRHILSDERLC